MLYEVFGISRQAYYKRIHSQEKEQADTQAVMRLVSDHRKEQPRLGTLKVFKMIKPDLDQLQIKLGRDKFFDTMREHRMLIQRKKRFHKTTNSNHRFRKHPNRIKGKIFSRSEEVWVSDITYIKTEEGYKYLSLITDLYSKKIMGFHLAENLKTESSIVALKMALANRQYPGRRLIHHSDRGFQYCSDEYTEMLEANKVAISMTQSYDPYENAVAERINGILKQEFDIEEGFIDHAHASREIKNAIRVYNTMRPHMSCDYMTPEFAHRHQRHKPKCYARILTSSQLSTKEKRTKKEKAIQLSSSFN